MRKSRLVFLLVLIKVLHRVPGDVGCPGLGKGGRGYFGLDVSEPKTMLPTDVKWEFPNSATAAVHIADMGYSYSRPIIVRSNLDQPFYILDVSDPNGVFAGKIYGFWC